MTNVIANKQVLENVLAALNRATKTGFECSCDPDIDADAGGLEIHDEDCWLEWEDTINDLIVSMKEVLDYPDFKELEIKQILKEFLERDVQNSLQKKLDELRAEELPIFHTYEEPSDAKFPKMLSVDFQNPYRNIPEGEVADLPKHVPVEDIKVWTKAYRPWLMGGDPNADIAYVELLISTPVHPIGKGYYVYAIQANDNVYYVETQSGALLGNDIALIRKDVKEADEEVMVKQITDSLVHQKEAELMSEDDFWKYLKG